jgi:hypothetical protein
MEKLERIIRISRMLHPRHNFEGHIMETVKWAAHLSSRYGGDSTVCLPGAYLHDIGRVAVCGKKHDLTGYPLSYAIARISGYDPKKAGKIARTVLCHNAGSKDRSPKTTEEKIVAEADALSHFSGYQYLLAIRYSDHGKGLNAAKAWTLRKIEKSFASKIVVPGTRGLAKKLYEEAKEGLCRGNPKVSVVACAPYSGSRTNIWIRALANQAYVPLEVVYVDYGHGKDLTSAANIADSVHHSDGSILDAFDLGAENSTGDLVVLCKNHQADPYLAWKAKAGFDLGIASGPVRWNLPERYRVNDGCQDLRAELLGLLRDDRLNSAYCTRNRLDSIGGFGRG